LTYSYDANGNRLSSSRVIGTAAAQVTSYRWNAWDKHTNPACEAVARAGSQVRQLRQGHEGWLVLAGTDGHGQKVFSS
jgi:hypothetical protein